MPTHVPLPRLRAATAALAAILLAAGCARGSMANGGAASPSAESETSAATEGSAAPSLDSTAELLLLEARERLARGELGGAAEAYRAFLGFRGRGPGTEHALWALAVIHLAPDSPVRDVERGTELLDLLADRHAGTVEGVQARWVRNLLGELARSRAQVAEQEQTIRLLNETLEQLKRIDLNRRPTVGRPPDSLSVPHGRR